MLQNLVIQVLQFRLVWSVYLVWLFLLVWLLWLVWLAWLVWLVWLVWPVWLVSMLQNLVIQVLQFRLVWSV